MEGFRNVSVEIKIPEIHAKLMTHWWFWGTHFISLMNSWLKFSPLHTVDNGCFAIHSYFVSLKLCAVARPSIKITSNGGTEGVTSKNYWNSVVKNCLLSGNLKKIWLNALAAHVRNVRSEPCTEKKTFPKPGEINDSILKAINFIFMIFLTFL